MVSVLVVLAALAAGIGVAAWMAWPGLRQWAVQHARDATGRDLAIDGRVSLDLLSWTPSLRAEDVRLSNAAWGSRPDMATIRRLDLVVDAKALLRAELRIVGLRLEGADLLLEEDAQGRTNWRVGTADPEGAAVRAAAPEDRSELPRIERVEIADSRLTYRSPKLTEPIVAEFRRLTVENRPEGLVLSAEGRYQARPFTLAAHGGGMALLRDGDKPYPLAVEATVGATRARLSGTMADPVRFLGFDADLGLAGDSLEELYHTIGLPLPASPPYELTGRLVSARGLWRLDGFRGRLGGSDMAGSLAVDTGRAVPFLRAEISSDALRMEDLKGFVGEDDPKGRDDEGALLPAEPIDLAKLRAMDAEVRFTGKRIVTAAWLLDDIATRFTLKGGRLVMDPLRFGVAGGSVGGLLVVDGRRDVPAIRADLRLRRLDFGALMKDLDPQKVTTGRIGGRADFTARGRSVREMAMTAEGRVLAYMLGGTIGNQILEMVALDFPQLVLDWFGGGGEVWNINCAIFPFHLDNGVLRAEHLVLDAPYDTILGRGHIDLRGERVLFELTSRPRDFSLFNTPSVLTIRGDLRTRRAEVDKAQVVGETIKKLLLAPFAPFMTADDEDLAPCRPAEQAARPRG